MPDNIIQFQVVLLPAGGQVVWALNANGELYFSNSSVNDGAWQEYTRQQV